VASPKRPYKNLADFCQRQAFFANNREEIDYPCLTCKAWGQVVVEYDNSYEGRNTYGKCPDCKGTRKGPKAACQAAYRAAIQTWESHKAHYQEALGHWQAAQAKLTQEERRALSEFGVEHGTKGQQRDYR
jgi:DnaJ-class molecular chaperone